ncbi:MAG: efflux RND transporter permease subunit, partial [Spirochaeta sp.]|nr:efflux RND transporter permease subunit [Spirochaeta sp.]
GEHSAFLQAETPEELAILAARVDSIGLTGSGLTESDLTRPSPSIQLSLQPDSLSNSGGSVAAVIGALQFIGEGQHIADIRVNGRETPVRLFLEPAGLLAGPGTAQSALDKLNSLEIVLPGGTRTLNLLGSLSAAQSPEALYRSNRRPAMPVPPAVVRAFDSAGGAAGATLFVPEREQSAASATELARAAATAVLLILLLLSAVFESPRQALLVLGATLPCATAGLMAVWLAGGSINLGVGLGLIMLFGNAVNTTILPTALLHNPGVKRSPSQAVQELGRGILFSTLSTAAALLPALLAGLQYPGIHSYTALPLFAGLLFGTPLSLLIFLAFAGVHAPDSHELYAVPHKLPDKQVGLEKEGAAQ